MKAYLCNVIEQRKLEGPVQVQRLLVNQVVEAALLAVFSHNVNHPAQIVQAQSDEPL